MKKFNLLLTVLALAFVIPKASADVTQVIDNYVETFDEVTANSSTHEISTPYWGHIVESAKFEDEYGWGSYDDYVSYYVDSEGGYDNSPFLRALSQTVGYPTAKVNDLIVTPAVSGTVTMQLTRTSSYDGGVQIFYCTRNDDGSFTKGDAYPVEIPELTKDVWTPLTIENVPEGTYLGIRLDYSGIDQFTATKATITLKKQLEITSVENLTPISYSSECVDAGPDGNATITLKATITNTGDLPFEVGDEGYSFCVYDYTAKKAYPAVAATETLAPGAGMDVTVTATVPVTEKFRHRWDVMENYGGTSKYCVWLELYPYTPVFQLSEGTAAAVIEEGALFDFGMQNADCVKSFRLRNNSGGAPCAINSISVPEGFSFVVRDKEDATITYNLPCTIPAHSEYQLDVTMLASAPGVKEGTMTITTNESDVLNVTLKGTILDPTKWYVDFEDQKFPDGSYLTTPTSHWSISSYNVGGNKYLAKHSTSSTLTKMISPKLRVEDGEALTFQVSVNGATTLTYLNVYYSTDRKNWTQVKTLTNGDFDTSKESAYPYPYKLKTFTVESIPAGEYYIAFESGYANIDNIYGFTVLDIPAVDFVQEALTIPESAEVNTASGIKMTVGNAGSASFEAGEITAKLIVDGKVVEEKALGALKRDSYNRNSSATASFDWTPRAAGTASVKMQLVAGDTTFESETKQVTVGAEPVSGWLQVGTITSEGGNTGTVPIYANYCTSESESVYTADMINLEADAKIYKVMYRGYNTSSAHTTHVVAYIENTTDATPASQTGTTTAYSGISSMTKIYDGDYTFVTQGSSADKKEHLVFDITNTPFVYTGDNIRIIVQHYGNTYKSQYFEPSETEGQCVYRNRNGQKTLEDLAANAKFSATKMPIVNFGVDAVASVFSGKVTSTDETPVADAAVKLTCDNVEYSGTTDAEGNFSFDVIKNTLDYTLTVAKEGFFPYTHAETLNLAGAATLSQNVTIEPAVGFKVISSAIPASATVNNNSTVSVTAISGVDFAADSYTAKLYLDEVEVATAETPAIEALTEHTFNFTFMPHAVSDAAQVKIELIAQGKTATAEGAIEIKAETALAEVQVGERTNEGTKGPVYHYYKNSKVEMIYPASMINLPAGTKMEAIRFKGYHNANELTSTVNIWIKNVPAGTALIGDDVSDMDHVMTDYIKDFSTAVGSSSNHEDEYVIEFPEGYVYEGGDLRIVTTQTASKYISLYYALTNVANQARYAASDNTALANLSLASGSTMALPVIYINVSPYKTVSGTVTADGAAVAGQEIKLEAENGVQYTGTTDETGAYSIQVIQHSLDYTLSVVKEGYKKYTAPISFADGDVTHDVTLVKPSYKITGTAMVYGTEDVAPGVTVELTDAAYEVAGSTTTDENGKYEFIVTKPGTYDLYIYNHQDYTFMTADQAVVEENSVTVVANAYVQLKAYGVFGTVTDASTGNPITNGVAGLRRDGSEEIIAQVNLASYGMYYFESDVTLLSKYTYNVVVWAEGYMHKSKSLDFSTLGPWSSILEGQDIALEQGMDGVGALTAEGFKAFGGQGTITVTMPAGKVSIYNATGALVREAAVEEGTTTLNGFATGIYIVNGVKVAVK